MRVISGFLGGRRYTPPTEPGLRPMTDLLRESLFNMLESRLDLTDIRFLDLFAGSGSMTWECLSRGASLSVMVELNSANIDFIKKTALAFNVQEAITLKRQRVERFLSHDAEAFGFVFLDPPYKLANKAALVNAVLKGPHLAPDGVLVMHHPTPEHYGNVPGFAECREHGGAKLSFFKRLI